MKCIEDVQYSKARLTAVRGAFAAFLTRFPGMALISLWMAGSIAWDMAKFTRLQHRPRKDYTYVRVSKTLQAVPRFYPGLVVFLGVFRSSVPGRLPSACNGRFRCSTQHWFPHQSTARYPHVEQKVSNA